MLDPATIASLSVAAFTGLLAFATFLLARAANRQIAEGRKQQRLLTYQASAMRSQFAPLLKLHSWKVKENKLVMEIENMGSGRGYWVGVEAWLSPCMLSVSMEEGGRAPREDEIRELVAQGGTTLWTKAISLDDKKLVYEEHKDVTCTHMVGLLSNSRLGGEPLLDPQERRTVELEPHFGIGPRSGSLRKQKWLWPFGGMDFNQAKHFLQSNGVRFAALGFAIICRNSIEDNVFGESFGHYVMFVSEDGTLEDVFKRNFTHSLVTLGERELPKLKYIEGELYKKGRFPKPPDEDESS